jgi:hypothetical protein
MKYANFFFFWILTTFAISRADPIGLFLSVVGFLIMHNYIEELFDNHG